MATAPPAQSWLLLEHPGPWPVRAIDALEPSLGPALAAKAEALAARVLLVRRPGRRPEPTGSLRWAVADARPGREAIGWSVAHDLREVLLADWDDAARPGTAARAGDPAGDEPVALVCTHGRHDVCCAVRGRPVAAALEAHWPSRVWECSHLGGDRFAASVLLLPHGLCYGRVEASDAASVLDAYAAGRVQAGALRGRSAFTRAEQAAQALVREREPSRDRLDDLLPLASHRVDDDTTEVLLAGDPPLRVLVRERAVPLGTPATCRSTTPGVGVAYALAGLEPAPPAVTP